MVRVTIQTFGPEGPADLVVDPGMTVWGVLIEDGDREVVYDTEAGQAQYVLNDDGVLRDDVPVREAP